jgi:hypothetical protein
MATTKETLDKVSNPPKTIKICLGKGNGAVDTTVKNMLTYTKQNTTSISSEGGSLKCVDPQIHGWMLALHSAFADEKDFTIEPDHVLNLLIMALARHVNQSPQKYRKLLALPSLDDQNVKKIEVDVEVAYKDWANGISKLVDGVDKHLSPNGKTTELMKMLRFKFSTSTTNDLLVRNVLMLDAVKSFFDLKLHTLCGIQNIHIGGTQRDWTLIRDSVEKGFAHIIDKKEWGDTMKTILQNFVDVFDEKKPPNLDFWRSIYKYKASSGSYMVSGWALQFFPHIQKLAISNFAEFGSGLSAVPFSYRIISPSASWQKQLRAGFDFPDLSQTNIVPRVGWAVVAV